MKISFHDDGLNLSRVS